MAARTTRRWTTAGSAYSTVVCLLLASSAAAAAQSDTARAKQDTVPLYRDSQVTKKATDVRWPTPRYPDSLRARNIEGEVVLQFVVDATGRIELNTVRVIRSSHPDFTLAVTATMHGARFTPAVYQGRPVRQLMERPFYFKLSRWR